MTRADYIALMKFPPEWDRWGMLPDDFIAQAIWNYAPGHEEGSEHDRNGAFHFWLRQHPSKDRLVTLYKLSLVEPDRCMANDWRVHLASAKACDDELLQILRAKMVGDVEV